MWLWVLIKYKPKIIVKREIEQRLIDLAIDINNICKELDNSYLSYHLTAQIIRSSTSATLNYGEAQGAESRKDFIHKNSIVLKELKETKISLQLLNQSISSSKKLEMQNCKAECDELSAIFYRMVETARKNNR